MMINGRLRIRKMRIKISNLIRSAAYGEVKCCDWVSELTELDGRGETAYSNIVMMFDMIY